MLGSDIEDLGKTWGKGFMHRETEKFWVCFSSWVLFLFIFSSCILIVLLHARRVVEAKRRGLLRERPFRFLDRPFSSFLVLFSSSSRCGILAWELGIMDLDGGGPTQPVIFLRERN